MYCGLKKVTAIGSYDVFSALLKLLAKAASSHSVIKSFWIYLDNKTSKVIIVLFKSTLEV